MQNSREHVSLKVPGNAADELGGWLTRQLRRGQTNGTAFLKCLPLLVFCLVPTGVFSQGAEHSSRDALLQKEEQALRQGLSPEVIRDLQPIQARNPEDVSVGLLLARAYLYSREDEKAITLLRTILMRDATNRVAMIELARAYGYQGHYKQSEALYRALLRVDSADEAAEIGLIRDFLHAGQTGRARAWLTAALKSHPESVRLRELQRRLSALEEQLKFTAGAVQGRHYVTDRNLFLADAAGNRLFDTSLSLRMELAPRLPMKAYISDRLLSSRYGEGTGVSLQSATILLQARATNRLTFTAGGGGLRFSGGASKGLYHIGGEYRPVRHMWIDFSYAMRPVAPTESAAASHLVARGLVGEVAWRSPAYEINGTIVREHYSDGNNRREEELDAMHWFRSPRLSVGGGYRFRHLAFEQLLHHGYFSPDKYFNHGALAELRLSSGSRLSADYKLTIGAESISSAPYTLVYEAILAHKWETEKWDVNADYLYYHYTQASGAYQAHGVRFGVTYRFGKD